jgi:hypothetical protein
MKSKNMTKTATKPSKNLSRGPGPARILADYKSREIRGAVPFVETMILPEDARPQRLPDDNISASAVFDAQEVFNVNIVNSWDPETMAVSTDDTNLESLVACYGRIASSIFNLSNTSIPLPGYVRFESLSHTTVGGYYYPFFSSGVKNCGLMPRLNSAGVPVIAIPIPFTETPTITVSAAGSWSIDLYYTDGTIASKPGWGSLDVKPVSDLKAIALRLAQDVPMSFDVYTTGGFSLPRGGTTFQIRSFDNLLGMNLTSQERCTALSALYTYQGSDLDNGGQIAAARLPPLLSPTLAENSPYSFLAELPTYSGDYPLKSGAYVWWMPESSREFDYIPYGKAQHTIPRTSLWLAANHSVKTVCRVRITAHFETLTRSQQYTTAVSDSNPLLPDLLSLAKTMPAVSENPEHKNMFSKIWGKVKQVVSDPSNWLKAAEVGLPYLATLL